jgi:putative membrane protein
MPATTQPERTYRQEPLHLLYSALFAGFWVYTGLTTPDLQNWLLENTLTLSLIIFLVAFYNIFRFSNVSYTLIFLFLLLHVYGSQYQYPDNPFGEWLKGRYGFERNHYDRLVHLGYGLLLTYPMFEALAYGFKLRPLLTYLLPVEFVLSTSMVYELVEWMVADWVYGGGQEAMDFLGMQGDRWDAQKDAAMALAGAVVAMAVTFAFTRRRRTGKKR